MSYVNKLSVPAIFPVLTNSVYWKPLEGEKKTDEGALPRLDNHMWLDMFSILSIQIQPFSSDIGGIDSRRVMNHLNCGCSYHGCCRHDNTFHRVALP